MKCFNDSSIEDVFQSQSKSLGVKVGSLLLAESCNHVDEPPVVLDLSLSKAGLLFLLLFGFNLRDLAADFIGTSEGTVNLAYHKRDGDINCEVFESCNRQTFGLEVKETAGGVEEDIVAPFGLGKRFRSDEFEQVALLPANADFCVLVHTGKGLLLTKLCSGVFNLTFQSLTKNVFCFNYLGFIESNSFIVSLFCDLPISKKQILSVTLVDLVYRDTITYIYFGCLMVTTSVIHCLSLNNDTLTVSYTFATVYSVLICVSVSTISISLIFSGVLRLISLIHKSEAAGLQLLGSDYIALNKIRLVSVTFSILFPCLLIYFFNAHPGYFPVFYGTESNSLFQDIENNWALALYLVLPFSATVVNGIAKIYSDFTKENIDRRANIFTIYGSKQCVSEGKVILSLEVTIGIPLLF